MTIVRDSGFGVPHVYGKTRAGHDVRARLRGRRGPAVHHGRARHAGRAELSSFAGGSAGNRAQDHTQWELAPYREEDLQRQYNLADEVYGAAGTRLQQDVTNYVAGINTYIDEARINPLKMPGEYAAIGKPGPADWKVTDVIATASLIGGIFGKGGGRELDSALAAPAGAEALREARRGKRVWADLRSAEDPEAPETVLGKRFPYRAEPRRLRAGGVAMPDAGTVKRLKISNYVQPAPGRTGSSGPPVAMSNALLVSGRESKSGRPIAVFGPQTAYFAPQLLHGRGRARARDRRARRDLRRHQPVRAARPRARLRLERHLGGPGHHRHLRGAAVRAGRLEADGELDALPLPRPVPAHRRDGEDEQLDAERRGRHAARVRDAPRRAHQPRPRDRARHGARQAGGIHQAARRPTTTRPTRRSGSWR